MPPNPTPTPWSWRRWMVAATRRRGSCSARTSTPGWAVSSSTPTTNRAKAGNSRPIEGPRWFFIGTIAIGKCVPRGRSNCSRMPRTTPIFAPEPGKAASARGPANKANPWNRVRRWGATSLPRRAALGFPTKAPAARNRTMSPWRFRGRPIGGVIGCAPMPWSCGWKASSVFTTARAGRELCLIRASPARTHPGRSPACSLESPQDAGVAKTPDCRIDKGPDLRRHVAAARGHELHRQRLRLEILQ